MKEKGRRDFELHREPKEERAKTRGKEEGVSAWLIVSGK